MHGFHHILCGCTLFFGKFNGFINKRLPRFREALLFGIRPFGKNHPFSNGILPKFIGGGVNRIGFIYYELPEGCSYDFLICL